MWTDFITITYISIKYVMCLLVGRRRQSVQLHCNGAVWFQRWTMAQAGTCERDGPRSLGQKGFYVAERFPKWTMLHAWTESHTQRYKG